MSTTHFTGRNVRPKHPKISQKGHDVAPNGYMADVDPETIADRWDEFVRRATRMVSSHGVYGREDAVQDLALASLEKDLTATLDQSRGNAKSFAVGILRNLSRSGTRKFSKRPQDAICSETSDDGSNPEAIAIKKEFEAKRREVKAKVRNAIRQLPVAWRQAIYKKFGEMGEQVESGDNSSGKSTPSVHRKRARDRLRKVLEPLWLELCR